MPDPFVGREFLLDVHAGDEHYGDKDCSTEAFMRSCVALTFNP